MRYLLSLFLLVATSAHAAFTTIPGTINGAPDLATTATLNNYVPVTRTVAGHALNANVTVSKSDVGLGNADNTSDANKPVSTATQAALNLKATSGQIIDSDVSGNAAIVSTKLAGVADGTTAQTTGQLGEYFETLVTTANALTGITNPARVFFDFGSLTLTAGDWDVTGVLECQQTNTVSAQNTRIGCSIATAVGNDATGSIEGSNYFLTSLLGATNGTRVLVAVPSCRVRITPAGVKTINLKGSYQTTAVTSTSFTFTVGRISARRVR